MAPTNSSLDALTSSLRSARAARGGRSRHAPPPPPPNPDTVVQQTDSDAAGSRSSAVSLGYLEDDFASAFARSGDGSGEQPRRQPIINRGTYVRAVAVDGLVDRLLGKRPSQKHQIISLGAGTDTRFFRLAKRRLEEQGQEDQGGQHILEHHQTEHNKHHQNLDLLYHEIDFPFTTAAKIRSLEGSETTKELLTRCSPTYTISADRASLKSSTLNIHALDLRTFSASTDLPNLDPSAPTLILSEMCLTYLPSSTTISILQNLLNTLQNTTSIILYEPLHPTDPFGRTMIANLASRGIRLPGLEEVPTLEAQKTRLQGLGFEETQGRTVREWWDTEVDGQEKERLRGCEWVDEEEEWNLLGEHYGLIWGTRPPRAAEG